MCSTAMQCSRPGIIYVAVENKLIDGGDNCLRSPETSEKNQSLVERSLSGMSPNVDRPMIRAAFQRPRKRVFRQSPQQVFHQRHPLQWNLRSSAPPHLRSSAPPLPPREGVEEREPHDGVLIAATVPSAATYVGRSSSGPGRRKMSAECWH